MAEHVVVGVDGSTSSRRAVRWAAATAALIDVPLRLVNVYDMNFPLAVPSLVPLPGGYLEAVAAQGVDYLKEAAGIASATRPELRITTDQRAGFIQAELVAESEDARMIVLGSRGLGGFTGLMVGSNAVTLAARGHCPVIVVRGETTPASSRPVVVGVSASDTCHDAVGFAFEHAARRGVPLVAVLAWHEPMGELAGLLRSDESWRAAERQAREVVAEAVAGWADKYPGVDVRTVVEPGRAAAVLLDQARQADLIVVGSRGRGSLRGLLLGSTSHALLHHAECPVAVVRPCD